MCVGLRDEQKKRYILIACLTTALLLSLFPGPLLECSAADNDHGDSDVGVGKGEAELNIVDLEREFVEGDEIVLSTEKLELVSDEEEFEVIDSRWVVTGDDGPNGADEVLENIDAYDIIENGDSYEFDDTGEVNFFAFGACENLLEEDDEWDVEDAHNAKNTVMVEARWGVLTLFFVFFVLPVTGLLLFVRHFVLDGDEEEEEEEGLESKEVGKELEEEKEYVDEVLGNIDDDDEI